MPPKTKKPKKLPKKKVPRKGGSLKLAGQGLLNRKKKRKGRKVY